VSTIKENSPPGTRPNQKAQDVMKNPFIVSNIHSTKQPMAADPTNAEEQNTAQFPSK